MSSVVMNTAHLVVSAAPYGTRGGTEVELRSTDHCGVGTVTGDPFHEYFPSSLTKSRQQKHSNAAQMRNQLSPGTKAH